MCATGRIVPRTPTVFTMALSTHELARRLLVLPDAPILVWDFGEGGVVNANELEEYDGGYLISGPEKEDA